MFDKHWWHFTSAKICVIQLICWEYVTVWGKDWISSAFIKINPLWIKYSDNEKNKTIKSLSKNTRRLIHKLEARSTFKTEYKSQNPKRKRQIKLTPNKCKAFLLPMPKTKDRLEECLQHIQQTNDCLFIHNKIVKIND